MSKLLLLSIVTLTSIFSAVSFADSFNDVNARYMEHTCHWATQMASAADRSSQSVRRSPRATVQDRTEFHNFSYAARQFSIVCTLNILNNRELVADKFAVLEMELNQLDQEQMFNLRRISNTAWNSWRQVLNFAYKVRYNLEAK